MLLSTLPVGDSAFEPTLRRVIRLSEEGERERARVRARAREGTEFCKTCKG